MSNEILTLTKEEVARKLLDGEKLIPHDWDTDSYCIYRKEYKNPFRIHYTNRDEVPMDSAWNITKWKIYKEPQEFWEPKDQEYVWCIDLEGYVRKSYILKSDTDRSIIKIGNVFETKENAETYVEYRQAEHRLCKAVWELNKGESPEFEYGAENCSICLAKNEPVAHTWVELQVNPDWFYFKSIELAKKLVETHKEDLLIYLHGV